MEDHMIQLEKALNKKQAMNKKQAKPAVPKDEPKTFIVRTMSKAI